MVSYGPGVWDFRALALTLSWASFGRTFKAAVQCLLGYCSINVKVSVPTKLRSLSLFPLNEIHNVTHINT